MCAADVESSEILELLELSKKSFAKKNSKRKTTCPAFNVHDKQERHQLLSCCRPATGNCLPLPSSTSRGTSSRCCKSKAATFGHRRMVQPQKKQRDPPFLPTSARSCEPVHPGHKFVVPRLPLAHGIVIDEEPVKLHFS